MTIVKKGHIALSEKSKSVEHHDDVTILVSKMYQEMIKNNGIGLAANQLGTLKRVIVIATHHFNSEVINPVLLNGRFEKESKEGCLSFPGETSTKKRFNRITIQGFDRNWNPISKNLKALSAFVAQHEVDHLNGITIKD